MAKNTPRYGFDNPTPTWRDGNFPAILAWMGASAERSTVLCGLGRAEALGTVLGHPHQTWVGGSEQVRHKVWRVDADGVPVWILSSRLGVVYEVEHASSPWDGQFPAADVERVLALLGRLYLELEEVSPVQAGPGMRRIAVEDDPVLSAARAWLDARANPPRP